MGFQRIKKRPITRNFGNEVIHARKEIIILD